MSNIIEETVADRKRFWVRWEEPDLDKGKFSIVPSSWISNSEPGEKGKMSLGSMVICKNPNSGSSLAARIVRDPNADEMAKMEVAAVEMETIGFRWKNQNEKIDLTNDRASAMTAASTGSRKEKSPINVERKTTPCLGNCGGGGGNNSEMKEFFAAEMNKMCFKLQANFSVLNQRIGVMEADVKTIKERVAEVENLLQTAVHDFDEEEEETELVQEATTKNGRSDDSTSPPNPKRRKSKSVAPPRVDRSQKAKIAESRSSNQKRKSAYPTFTTKRKTHTPRPNAVVVTSSRDRNLIYLGGDQNYRMPMIDYVAALRHARHPTASYMVTSLLRRYLPEAQLAHLCVKERTLAAIDGAEMIDFQLLAVLKKQARMQFPNTPVDDEQLLARIEEVARDVRCKLKKRGGPKVRKDTGRFVKPKTATAFCDTEKTGQSDLDEDEDEDQSDASSSGEVIRLNDADVSAVNNGVGTLDKMDPALDSTF